MPSNSLRWDELTAFQRCQPSTLAFRALVALLDTWPNDQAAAIEFAEQNILNSWPDSTRLAPWSWCKAAARGHVLPTWRLVRSLQMTTNHITKCLSVNLAQLAHHANLTAITELLLPKYTDFTPLSFLYHRPEAFPSLKKLHAVDNKRADGEVRALTNSPLWESLEEFSTESLTDSLNHSNESRIVPHFVRPAQIQSLSLRALDLIAAWDKYELPQLRHASVFIRSIEEASQLAARHEVARLTSLSIAFRCGFSGSSPFEPYLGNVIEADEAAAEAFFSTARLDQLEKLAITGYHMGYWGREGLGRLGLNALITSGVLQGIKHLRLELLPLGDAGIAALTPVLGKQLETLELVDVYCKGNGARALIDSPCLPSLRHLNLSGNRIDADSFVEMAKIDMPHLEILNLNGPRINPYYFNIGQQPLMDRGAVAWINSTNTNNLKELHLQNCHLTDEAIVAVFQSPKLRKLERLDLSHNSFTAAAMAQAISDSPLWQTLQELGLNNCRLGDAAIEALVSVTSAPHLRSLTLGYNSVGPKGATTLANWKVLTHVWQLDLHDNAIGNTGLMALASSPHTGRLLELDLEQDCWNSRKFTFSDEAASALANSQSLRHLDAIFSGCVDEYHGGAYSPGFTKDGLNEVRSAPWMRPSCRASCSDFSGVSDYSENGDFNEDFDLDTDLSEHDFRQQPMSLSDREAVAKRHGMQQLSSAARPTSAFDFDKPPVICSELPKVDLNAQDIIEGLEYIDPTPISDATLRLTLMLTDIERPLPAQVSKYLTDTLRTIFKACSLGSFDVSGSSSRQGEDGRYIPVDESFVVGIKGDPQQALHMLREVLWWIGAPADTALSAYLDEVNLDLDRYRFDLQKKPKTKVPRLLQLATLKIHRWKFNNEPGHRIDRVPFTAKQRLCVQDLMTESQASPPSQGWRHVKTNDGGHLAIYVKYLKDSPQFDSLNLLAEKLTPEVSELVFKLVRVGEFMLLPMALAASEEVANTVDCEWPKVKIAGSAAEVHEMLSHGPYQWWMQKS